MNDHEVTTLAEQVDSMHERIVTLEAQVAGLLDLLAQPKVAELLGPDGWRVAHLATCSAGTGRAFGHKHDRNQRARTAEREAQIDRLIRERMEQYSRQPRAL